MHRQVETPCLFTTVVWECEGSDCMRLAGTQLNLTNKHQRVKITFTKGYPQKYLWGSARVSFGTFAIQYMSSEIWNFADDSTIYACGDDIHEIVMVLEMTYGNC